MGQILAWLGLANAGDVWTGGISKPMYYAPIGGMTWKVCSSEEPPSPLSLIYYHTTWSYNPGPYVDWVFLLQVFSPASGYTYTITFVGGATWDWDCCGADATVTMRLAGGSDFVDSTGVTYSVALTNNRCCNCRGTSTGYYDETTETWIGIENGTECGPTSDGSVSQCGGTSDDEDANSCPDSVIGDTSKRNMCTGSQDADCLPVCSCVDVPDDLTIDVGGDIVPLVRTGSCRWEYHKPTHGGDYRYRYSYRTCWEEYTIYDEEENPIEVVPAGCQTLTGSCDVFNMILEGSCGGPCIDGVTNCWSIQFHTLADCSCQIDGGTPFGCGCTAGCFAGSIALTPVCDSPIGDYQLYPGCACNYVPGPDEIGPNGWDGDASGITYTVSAPTPLMAMSEPKIAPKLQRNARGKAGGCGCRGGKKRTRSQLIGR